MSQSLSKVIRKLRTEKGLSQQQLAEKMYVTRSTVARWESGSRLPDAAMLMRLSEYLGADIDTLMRLAASEDAYPNVIVVDDNRIVLTGELSVLEQVIPGANVTGFLRPSEALEYAKANRIALAFLDIEMGTESGLDLCRSLLEINPRTNVIYLTAYSEYSLEAWGTGACGFMLKPVTIRGMQEQLKRLRYPFMLGEIRDDRLD